MVCRGKGQTMKVYRVIWEDAVTVNNTGINELKRRPPELVETYGQVYKNDKYVYVMTHNAHNDECCDFLRIPKPLVKKIIKP